MVTTVEVDGRAVDVRRTTFGFREWEWNGPQFKLNGVPWQLWADCTLAETAARTPRRRSPAGEAAARTCGGSGASSSAACDKQQALDLMDAQGIIVRRSGIFDGQGANYLHQLANGTRAVRQLDRAVDGPGQGASATTRRSSIWSIENEITFINSRNLGLSQTVEPEIARAAGRSWRWTPRGR